jgi:hypothetical protein
MKKLLFGLIATVMLSISSFAQDLTPTSKVPTSVSLIGKYHAVITYLETASYYKAGMTEDAFIRATTACIEEQELKDLFKPYMSKIYSYHTKKLTSDQVYDLTDGRVFSDTINGLIKFESNSGHVASAKKPWWFNWLRKAIDFIDDNWK